VPSQYNPWQLLYGHQVASNHMQLKYKPNSVIIQTFFMKMHIDLSDPKVVDELFNENNVKYFHFAKSLIGDPEEARDIVADSYLKLLSQQYIQFANTTHLRSYLYVVVKNGCSDYLRRSKHKVKVEDHLKQTVPLAENVIERRYQQNELIQLIYRRIDGLPKQMKLVFKLTYLEGYNRSEVARRLKLSENTIRNTNAAALKAIRMTFLND
jgi:RNA polymerase sigma factor (sigma-70 family)